MENLENEIWVDVKGYEGYYEISNFGNIRSLNRYQFCKKNNSNSLIKGRLLKLSINKYGYYKTTICKESKRSQVLIHRLVLLSFLNEHNTKKIVNHINGNRLDNRLKNLEWVSHRENICHSRLNIKKSSKYIGVYWYKESNKWRAQISKNINKKRITIHLGLFDNELDAFNCRINYENQNNINNKYLQELETNPELSKQHQYSKISGKKKSEL